jgi:hypothetical protein
MTDQTPSRRAGLRDDLARAIHRYDRDHLLSRNDIPSKHHRGEADAVLALLYREWPWLKAGAEELEQARAELRQHAEAESAAAAAGSYALRAERAEAQRDQLAALVRTFLDPDPCRPDRDDDCRAHGWRCPRSRAREVLDALDDGPAIAQPERWLHVTFTSPHETTANTSALAIADHLTAEFDGVSMRITTNAVEAGPSCSPGAEETEPNNPAATEATGLRTRVTALYEQWVKAGPPPLGTPMARWWDRRLVEFRAEINGPTEQQRTTPNNPAGA